MPLTVQDIFDLPYYSTAIGFSLEPARSVLESLLLIAKVPEFPGAAEWVTTTAQSMSRVERKTNDLVMFGLHYAVMPVESWNSFPAYVDHLASLPPEELCERMLDVYDRLPPEYAGSEPILDRKTALASAENYLTYLRQRFCAENVNEQLERQAYEYVMDPPELQRVVVDHLREMWRKYLSAEWGRVRPMLQEAVRAFHQLDWKDKSFLEAARQVTGQNLSDEKWGPVFAKARRVTFVPHPHVGPYLMKFCTGDAEQDLILFFGARLPKGATFDAPDLNRAEIIVRLSALTDDNRLRILRYIAENGEQRSQELIDALEMSQSAASRHLTQLSATGYLNERRCEGAKCYALNPERITDTLQAIANYLLIGERS